MKLVCNFGINDLRDQRKTSKEFRLWCDMLNRCYSEKLHARIPTYIECIASEEFRRYSDFKAWCKNQIGFNLDDWQLDKDIIQKGNREYHPDKCVFLPREINLFLRSKKKSRGEFLVGVSKRKDGYGYGSQLSINGKIKYLGTFPTEIEAFNAYKYAKESEAKRLAEKHKFFIDARAYNELIAYIVDIND